MIPFSAATYTLYISHNFLSCFGALPQVIRTVVVIRETPV